VGYGYTADGGRTFPLRGAGVGLMPTLPEVLAAFPDRDLILHVKMNRPEDGELLADLLSTLPAERRARLWLYGGSAPLERVARRLPDLRSFDGQRLKSCLGGYLALGWTGWLPTSCRDTVLLVPVSHARWMWGWPRRFERRMDRAGTEVVLVGPWTGGNHVRGIDDPVTLSSVPGDFGGWVWTNDITALAPVRAASAPD
jgi:glycerophosphoryl diester phosphodiesterase